MASGSALEFKRLIESISPDEYLILVEDEFRKIRDFRRFFNVVLSKIFPGLLSWGMDYVLGIKGFGDMPRETQDEISLIVFLSAVRCYLQGVK